MIRLFVLFCALMCSTVASAASLTARLDRTDIKEGESLSLTVEARDLDGDIDFSVLEQDFDVLNVSRSRNVRIVNGRGDRSLTFNVALLPKRSGDLPIPSFSLGGEQTQALTVHVGEAPLQPPATAAGQAFFVEISADTSEPYVQQQVILSVKIYQSRDIVEGRISDPQHDGLVVQRLGDDVTYRTELQGQPYAVIERRFAVFPQESGSLRIAPVSLTATVRRKDRWSGGSFFAPTETIRVASNALELDVKARPAGTDSHWWLPAAAFGLSENWRGDTAAARVGEPLTRTISLSAFGVQETQLPVLQPPQIDGVKIYPDQPEVETLAEADGLQSYRTEKWAIIPQRAGEISLPPVRISWFDTGKGQLQEAVLPARTITVLPAANTAADTPPLTPQAEDKPAPRPETTPPPAAPAAPAPTAGIWPWLSAFSTLGWLATVLAWWARERRREAQPRPALQKRPDAKSALQVVQRCAQQNDPHAFRQAVLDWARARWPDAAPAALQDIARRLASEALAAAFASLDSALYGQGKTVDLTAIAALLEKAQAGRSAAPSSAADALPPL
ncbi:BatD family protein [Granulosicoccaceae sp. 1_MG-2023]|nr:BatD family protein [Granulosicoccaceae sp. 1_MG-2023]